MGAVEDGQHQGAGCCGPDRSQTADQWAADGTWERILASVPASADADGVIRLDRVGGLHRHPGPPAPRRSSQKGAAGRDEPVDHALGRSRGGLSTKVHLAADRRARPLAFTVTAGQAGDAPAFETVMARIRVTRTGLGRPRARHRLPGRTPRRRHPHLDPTLTKETKLGEIGQPPAQEIQSSSASPSRAAARRYGARAAQCAATQSGSSPRSQTICGVTG